MLKSCKFSFRPFGLFAFLFLGINGLLAHKPIELKPLLTDNDLSVGSNISIIENKGQWSDDILYRLKLRYGQMDFMQDAIHVTLVDMDDLAERGHSHDDGESAVNLPLKIHGMQWELLNANPNCKLQAQNQKYTYYNYFLGADESRWASHVHAYTKLVYKDIYEGIDLVFYESRGHLKYDFIVSPGVDPSQIALKINYADGLNLLENRLYIQTSVSELIKENPYTYIADNQSKEVVDCHYLVDGDVVRFEVDPTYDDSKVLVIDPELIFASYSGAIDDNWGNTATFDNDGNLIAGSSSFGDFPVVNGAFDLTFSGGRTDCAISKFNEDGSQLTYSTYLGGNNSDLPTSMIVNSDNEIVIYSITGSSDFPTSANAFSRTFGGGSYISPSGIPFTNGTDIAITRLSSDGSQLMASTYYGGSNNDGLITNASSSLNYSDAYRGEVILGENGEVFVASTTESTDLTLKNAFDDQYNTGNSGSSDGLVLYFSPDLSQLNFASYLGGTVGEAATSLKLLNNNELLVVGITASADFPTTSGVLQTLSAGGSDGFISIINLNDYSLSKSTYLGKSGNDLIYFTDTDSDGQIYVVGINNSGNWDVSSDVYSNDNSVNFLSVLNPDLTTISLSTLVGNGKGVNGRLVISAFLVDNCNRIYISGWGGRTNSTTNNIQGMPLTSDALQSTSDGSDFYLMVLKPDATGLEYATYFGGPNSREHVDGGTSRFSKEGAVYQAVCASCGGWNDFPVTDGAFSETNNSFNCNLGVFKIELGLSSIKLDVIVQGEDQNCSPYTVDFINSTDAENAIYMWNFGDNSTSTDKSPTHTYTQPGEYVAYVIATSSETCVYGDSLSFTITVGENLENHHFLISHCDESSEVLASVYDDSSYTYLWNTGETTQSIVVTQSGDYWVEIDNGSCNAIDSYDVTFNQSTSNEIVAEICEGEMYELNGEIYSSTGQYTQILKNSVDCDSTIMLDLTVNPIVESNLSYILCENMEITVNDQVYSSAGYFQQVINREGQCDSIINISIVESLETISLDFDDCDAHYQGNENQTYQEFIADISNDLTCGEVTASILYRNNPTVNIHSCTPDNNDSIAMCVSSYEACDYQADHDRAVRFNITVIPNVGEYISLNCLSFEEKAPLEFDWIDGDTGLNNFPRYYGIRILKNDVEIYRNEQIETENDWNMESFNFTQDENFTATEPSVYKIELLPYCVIGNGSDVTAWDLDDLSVSMRCGDLMSRQIKGKLLSNNNMLFSDVKILNKSGDLVKTTYTDNFGHYAFSSNPLYGEYEIEPHKNDDVRNGLTSADLLLIQKYILGLVDFDPYQIIAADANNNKIVSVSDIVAIRNVILWKTDAFPNNESWKFLSLEDELTLDNVWNYRIKTTVDKLSHDKSEVNFMGIKTGDVNGTVTNGIWRNKNNSRSTQVLSTVAKGNQWNFILDESTYVSGFQLGLNVCEAQVVSVKSDFFDISEYNYSQRDGQLYISVTDPIGKNLENDAVLFSVYFNENEYCQNNLLSTNSDFNNEIYVGEDAVEVKNLNLVTNNERNQEVVLYQNVPNPFNTSTEISFSLDKGMAVEINVYDMEGRVIATIQKSALPGLNTVQIENGVFPSNGMYVYQLRTKNCTLVKKMCLIER